MKRPARARGATSVSLFPFLAVLLCTMGSLIVVLVVIAQQARSQAERQETAQREQWEQQRQEALAEAAQLQQQREAALAQRESLQAQIAARRRELDALSARIAALENELAQLQQQSAKLPAVVAKQSHDDLEQQLQWYRRRIGEVEEAIRAANQKHGNGKTFAILPYGGRSGTDRRPIYIECCADRVILQPEGIELRPADFIHSRALSPLNAAILATIDHFEELEPLHRGYAYPMLLVRPDGIESYYKVLEALQHFRSQYGYEFIEQDWELELPPSDKQLARKQLEAIQMARRQLLRELQTRPSLVRGKPPSFSLSATGGGLQMVDGGERGTSASLPDRYHADPQGNARETGRGGYPDQPFAAGNALPSGTGGAALGGSGGLGGPMSDSFNGAGAGDTSYTSLPGEHGAASGSLAGPRYPNPGGYSSTPYGAADWSASALPGLSAGQGAASAEALPLTQTGRGSLDNPAGLHSAQGGGNQASGSFMGRNPANGHGHADADRAGARPQGGSHAGSFAPGGNSAERGYWVTGGERPSSDALASGGGYGWSRGNRQSRTSSNPYADLDLSGTSPAGGTSEHSAGSSAQGDNSTNSDMAGMHAGAAGTNASEAASSGFGASGPPSESADGTSAGGGTARPGAMSAGAAGGAAGGSPSDGATGGMPQVTMQHPPATRSIAATAGSNWALPHSSARSVAVWRDIRVRLEPDRMLLLSETGRVTQLVPLRGATAAAAYEIRNAVWQDMEHWGIAGYGMHWQPVLHVDVVPGAEQRFRDLQVLFDRSGFAIRDRNAAKSKPQESMQR